MTQATTGRCNLLGLDGVRADELAALLDEADGFVPAARGRETSDLLAGRVVANLFFEASTRTRCSFTVAANRLGAFAIDLTGLGSSLSKCETVLATAGVMHWLERLEAAGIPCGPVNDVAAVLDDPQVRARNMIVTSEDPTAGTLTLAGNPVKLSGVEDPPTRPAAPG